MSWRNHLVSTNQRPTRNQVFPSGVGETGKHNYSMASAVPWGPCASYTPSYVGITSVLYTPSPPPSKTHCFPSFAGAGDRHKYVTPHEQASTVWLSAGCVRIEKGSRVQSSNVV